MMELAVAALAGSKFGGRYGYSSVAVGRTKTKASSQPPKPGLNCANPLHDSAGIKKTQKVSNEGPKTKHKKPSETNPPPGEEQF
jgi:hypothetical protein